MKRSGNRPKNVKRKLKDLSGKERRFKANENHRISKLIVEKATDTKRGIGLEDLTEIRERTRFRPECGHIDKGNRPVRALFLCRSCAHFDHADVVGATNIACAARVAWREVAEQRLKVSRVVQRQAPPTTRFGV